MVNPSGFVFRDVVIAEGVSEKRVVLTTNQNDFYDFDVCIRLDLNHLQIMPQQEHSFRPSDRWMEVVVVR